MNGACEVCARANIKRSPFPSKSNTRATRPLERIHTDICGPLPLGHGNFKYFINFIDCYSRFIWEYPLVVRSDAFKNFLDFQTRSERQLGHQILNLRLDNAPELIDGAFKLHAKSVGLSYEKTVPDASQQNGVAERANWTLCSMARAMLIDSEMPDRFWPFAIQAAVHIKNRVPHSSLESHKTPFEYLYGRKPDVSHIRPFGSHVVFRDVNSDKLNKITPRGIPGRFIGYARDSKGYLIWVPHTHSVLVRRDVAFIGLPDLPKLPLERSHLWEDIIGITPGDDPYKPSHDEDPERDIPQCGKPEYVELRTLMK